jgi:hypothetical protein
LFVADVSDLIFTRSPFNTFTKVCTRCGDDFEAKPTPARPQGHSYCRPCRRQYMMRWYDRHRRKSRAPRR